MQKLAPLQEKIILNDFSHITLTQEEHDEALRKARENKHYRLELERYKQRLIAEPEIRRYTTDELLGSLKLSRNAKGRPFIIDRDNEQAVRLVCQYFAEDPAFEQYEDFSLNKGLALLGNVGVGKTHLMSHFTQNQHASFVMLNCRRIEGMWVEEAGLKDKPPVGVIQKYSATIQVAVNANRFGHKELGICFDDLGTETSPSKAYGEEKNVLGEILMNRYENFGAFIAGSTARFYMTHITTNLSAHDISIKYGQRLRDRFREMFNVITFPNDAKSRR